MMSRSWKAHKKAAQWRHTPFPLYDEIQYLVKGIVATGAGAFHAGMSPPPYNPFPDSDSDFDYGGMHFENAPSVAAVVGDHENTPIGIAAAPAPSPPSFIDDKFSQEVSSSQPGTPAIRKRVRADSESPSDSKSPAKRQVRGVRHSHTGDSIAGMTTAIMELASVMKGGPATPERRVKAINLVEDDDAFSDDEQAHVMVLFSRDIAIADTYMGIKSKSVRTAFVRAQMGDDN
jgi:hypothetical protein